MTKMVHQPPIIRTKPHRNPFLQLLLNLSDPIIHIPPHIPPTIIHCIHCTRREKTNRFIDMLFINGGGECHFGERFTDSDNGFELSDCDGDAGPFVGILFYLMDLTTDLDEVRGEHFGGFVVETRCTTVFSETDVRAHFVDGDLTLCGGGNGPVDMDIQHVLCDGLLSVMI